MKTNFFEHITGLALHGALNLNILKHPDNGLTVSVYLNSETSDKAGTVIPPMILKGTAEELDEKFFATIGSPLQKTSELFANMDSYQKSLDKAAAQSKQEQDKKAKANKSKTNTTTTAIDDDEDDEPETENLFSVQQNDQKEKAEKKQRYDEAMAQITELNKLCKYEEAISLLPQVEDYPDKAEELQRKANELQKRKKQYEELMQEI